MYNLIIVGGGTGGMIAAAYAKKAYGDKVNVTVIFDHKNPSIGVGESLTPTIRLFMSDVGITDEEMIKQVGSTVKIGLKFKNWLNDGDYYYHGFAAKTPDPDPYSSTAAYDIANDIYDSVDSYSDIFYDNCKIPNPRLTNLLTSSFHIDAVKFTNFLINKYKNSINIIDDIVKDVVVENNNIRNIVLEKNGNMSADFYIDASGFASVLMKKMNNKWVDKSDWLPIDKFIPCPVPTNWDDKKLPPYTTSEATDNGWILQVPLQNRWGIGYLYCSRFTSDEEAITKFNKWLKDNHNYDLTNPRCLSFKSGYWEEQWVGNCLVVGLASGFAEPLEATNIQHTLTQSKLFFQHFNYTVIELDRINYNKRQIDSFENIYNFLRFCYDTKRTDSEFWKYMTNNAPDKIKHFNERIEKGGYLTSGNVGHHFSSFFQYQNFICVANGLKKFNKDKIKQELNEKGLMETSKVLSDKLRRKKINMNTTAVDHYTYIMNTAAGK